MSYDSDDDDNDDDDDKYVDGYQQRKTSLSGV